MALERSVIKYFVCVCVCVCVGRGRGGGGLILASSINLSMMLTTAEFKVLCPIAPSNVTN